MRRDLHSRGVAAVALVAGALALAGCQSRQNASGPPPASESYDPGPPSPDYAPPPSEAQRTREMEAKQAEMSRKVEAARAGGMTPEEIEQAYKDYEQDRLDLNRAGAAAAPPPADAAAGDYPPPPL